MKFIKFLENFAKLSHFSDFYTLEIIAIYEIYRNEKINKERFFDASLNEGWEERRELLNEETDIKEWVHLYMEMYNKHLVKEKRLNYSISKSGKLTVL